MPVHTIHFRTRSGPSRALKWVAGLLLALIALLVAAVVVLATAGGDWLKGPAERMVQEKTGRALKIDGDIRLHFGWPLLRVNVGKVAFANAEWTRQPPNMLTADEVDFGVVLPKLITGHVVLDDLSLRNADVNLQQDAEGRKNWELPGGPSTVVINRAALDDSRIDYEDAAHKTSLHGTVTAAENGLEFNATGQYAGQALEAHGGGGPWLALSDDAEPYPFNVEATAGPTTVKAKGTVTGLKQLSSVDATTSLEGGSLKELTALLGASLPDTESYAVRGRVVRQGQSWRYEKFDVRIGDSGATGTLSVDVSGKRPAVTGELNIGTLDPADLGLQSDEEAKSASDRLLPDKPVDARRLGKLDADLRLSAQKIVLPKVAPIEHLATHLRLRDAALSLDPLEFTVAGGKLTGSASLDGHANPPHARGSLKIAKVAVDRLVPGFDTSKADPGRIDGAVDLSGKGDSVAKLLGNADGTAALLVNGGHVSRLIMEELGLHVGRIVALKARGDEPVGIRCGAADFKVNDGVMKAQTFVFDTTVTTIDGAGTIDLGKEALDLTLTPRTKETSLLSLHTPIHIRGTLRKPDVQLDKAPITAKAAGAAALALANPLLALAPLLETGPGTDSDCGRLLNGSEAAADARKTPAKAKPRQSRSPSAAPADE